MDFHIASQGECNMKCPKCGSSDVTSSHKRGIERVLQYVYPKAPFRCKECWSRFWKFQSPFAHRKSFLGTIVIVLLAVFFLVLPFFPHQENGVSSTGGVSAPGPEPDALPAEPSDTEALEFEVDVNAPETDAIVDPEERPVADAPEIPVTETPLRVEGGDNGRLPDNGATETAEPPAEREETAPASAVSVASIDEETPETPVAHEMRLTEAPSQPEPANKQKPLRRITSIQQIDDGADGFKMVVESNDAIGDYTAFTMERPHRMVVNLTGRWVIKGQRTFPMEDELVQQVRIGEHPRYLSVVLDLKRAAPALPEIRKTDKGFTLTLKNG
jgi:hypothetical protein